MNQPSAPARFRDTVMNLEESRIREVANAGMGQSDVLAFWFGESDEPTPDIVRQAAIASLQAGETFYSHNLGLPELREAVAQYMQELHGSAIGPERVAITSGGVNALMLAFQALIVPGDEVVAVTPVWPNLTAQPLIMGATLRCVSLRPQQGQWGLDLQALLDAITPATRVLVLNTPNNPTGAAITTDEFHNVMARIPDNVLVILDEAYAEFSHDPEIVCGKKVTGQYPNVVTLRTFSKAYGLAGLRIGYGIGPASIFQAATSTAIPIPSTRTATA